MRKTGLFAWYRVELLAFKGENLRIIGDVAKSVPQGVVLAINPI